MRKGKRLAVDFGSVRIGLATCDPDGILASPMTALIRSDSVGLTGEAIVKIAKELDAIEILVGDPISLSGTTTSSTKDAREFARQIAATITIPVRLVDERLTTVSAATKLRESGKSSRQAKQYIDSASAVEILEQALNFERSTGIAPGVLAGEFNV
jgi:putative Holliday junction resolvase